VPKCDCHSIGQSRLEAGVRRGLGRLRPDFGPEYALACFDF